MTQKHLVIAAVSIGAGVLLYVYLRKSGTLAQWFPSAPTNEFTDESALLAYCMQQNLQVQNGGQAVFTDQTGARHTASCVDWLSAQNGSGGGQTAGLAAAAPVDKTVLANLQSAAMTMLGRNVANVAQWNLILHEIDSQSAPLHSSETRNMTAAQYLGLRAEAGLTQLAPVAETFINPAAWVN